MTLRFQNVACINNSVESTSGLNLTQVQAVITQNIGRGISLGFDGILENNVLTFIPPEDSGIYDIKENYEYELDLHFAAVGNVSDTVEIEVENDGEMIQFWTVNHSNVITSITWKEFKKLSTYDEEGGYRWLFNARCRITSSGIKAFLIYPTIIKETV